MTFPHFPLKKPASKPTRTIRLKVWTECPSEDLHYDDKDVAGMYLIPVPAHFDDTTAATCALSAFHARVPVASIDCFDYDLFNSETGEEITDLDTLDCEGLARQAGAFFRITEH